MADQNITGKAVEKAKDKAVEKAKEALGLNDTSVDAKLILNGTEYEIDRFNIRFQKAFDFKGEPQQEVKGGIMSMEINHVVDKQINEWMFNQSVKHSGEVTFASFSRIATPVITIEFTNGRCFRYSKIISHSSASYSIFVTAEEIKINGIDHSNNQKLL
jgi:hypothetical protein